MTGDKDFFQLVDDTTGVRVFNPRDEGVWYDAEGVKTKFGVAPEQVVDVLALMGDSIDNIKGVPGIGEKGARDLISTHGSLDALLENAPSLTGKKRELLTTHADAARESRVMLRIRTDVPLPDVDVSCFDYRGPDRQKCFELFSTLGFRSLVTEFAPTADTVGADYAVVSTERGARPPSLSELESAGRFAMSVIGDCPGGMRRGAGRCRVLDQRAARAIPADRAHGARRAVCPESKNGFGSAEEVLENPLAREDRPRSQVRFDDAVARGYRARTASSSTRCSPATCSMRPGPATPSRRSRSNISATRRSRRKTSAAPDKRPSRCRTCPQPRCSASPASAPISRGSSPRTLRGRLRDDGLEPLFREMELPLVPVLADIERHGVRIDQPALASQSTRIDAELASRSAKIFELAGESFNINSPKQLSVILFDKLQLATGKRTGKTKVASTAVDVLEDLALTHELPRLILEWRALMKLKGTYIDALPQLVHARTARVHTSFNQAVAATGRLSSSDPNLQNIPIRTDLGREIRRAFIADPGFVLISADYSQIELRVLAHMAEEDALIEAFRRGEDIHDRTALKVFGPNSGLDKHELRRRAKIINYALLYGKTAFTLARDIGVTPAVAQEFIDAYFGGFPRVRTFIDATIEDARTKGFVETMFGRRRMVPELNSRNGQIRQGAERMTVNFPIQGIGRGHPEEGHAPRARGASH